MPATAAAGQAFPGSSVGRSHGDRAAGSRRVSFAAGLEQPASGTASEAGKPGGGLTATDEGAGIDSENRQLLEAMSPQQVLWLVILLPWV